MLVTKRVDGVLHMTTTQQDPYLEPLLAHDIPVVTFDRDYAGTDLRIDAVLIENERGAYLATKHLIDLGHRRIACIWVPSGKRQYRQTGCEAALVAAGICADPVLFYEGDWSLASGWEAAAYFMQLADPPTAIFASNDLMAIGAMACLNDRGIAVPQQVSVVGFDDITMARYSSPLLTTYATPIAEVGERMCRLLFDRIDGLLPSERQQVLVYGELKVRKSTAPCAVVKN